MRATVIGAGVAGLATALELAERGVAVELLDRGAHLGAAACSWFAGGMLAPFCEGESAEPEITTLGQEALDWWPRRFAGTLRNGTLVLTAPRDTAELTRFARRTGGFEWLDEDGVAALEPDLAGRFRKGLHFPSEGHLDPRLALAALADRLATLGMPPHFGVEAIPEMQGPGPVLDCRGMAARDSLPELRGVRGEMLILRCPEVTLSRPVRLLHPRIPIYVVPRADSHFMLGATMIESADRKGVTLRSAVELLNAAYTLHPAFAEAEIVELGADIRPAFPDNLPRLVRRGRILHVNGLYRHGFLLSPAMARRAAEAVLQEMERSDEDLRERRAP
jgi:glycine oxidase